MSIEERPTKFAITTGEREKEASQTYSVFELVIATEGEFVSSTVGEIGAERKKLIIPERELDQEALLGFKIKGLAAN